MPEEVKRDPIDVSEFVKPKPFSNRTLITLGIMVIALIGWVMFAIQEQTGQCMGDTCAVTY